MRKSKKTIAILAIIAMVLMMLPVQAFADNTSATTRLFGATRVDTAIQIANSGWANGATNVVVVPANDENLVDALAVAPLAKQLNAPVLITDKNSLDASVSAEIATLKASKVYAVGALSDAVVGQLKALSGVTVSQVKGADRFATAAQIASMLTSPAGSVVVGYNGLADALSAASYAAANGYAILVANTDGTVPANEAAYEGSTVIELGGPTLVADIAGAKRYFGADRYATNDQVIQNLSFKYDKVYVANGETLVDALSGAVLAALTNSPIVLANTQGAAAAADVFKNLTASSQVVAFGGSAVVPDSVVTAVKTGTTGTVPSGPVAVQSVKATGANTFQVTFTAAPADTSKVAFSVAMTGTAITVTPTWSDDKTQATLTGSSNFAPGTYTIGVKNDTTDLGSNTVTITQQQISKITITSKALAVTMNTDHVSLIKNGFGFVTYAVIDQYGNDITDSALANGITWTPGVGTLVYAKNGVIALDPNVSGSTNMSFSQYTSMSVTGYDTSSGVSTSATLPISSSGTLKSVTLNKLVSPNNDDFNYGNQTGQWYIDYSALDASGNPTSDYALVSEGIVQNQNINGGGYLNIKTVHDPNDNNKAAISVTINSGLTLNTDMTIPITIVTTNGQSSTLNVTLKKSANQVDSIILASPAQMVASLDTIDIPFTATDPTGKALTMYSDIVGPNNVTLSASNQATNTLIHWVRNSDGTASIEYQAPQNTTNSPITVYITATVTTTGKFSQLTLSIQKPAVPDTLKVSTMQFLQGQELNAAGNEQANILSVDFGDTYGGLTLNDQYGRAMDITDQDATSGSALGFYYYVVATTSGGSSLSVQSPYADNSSVIQLAATTAGTTTVNYEVWAARYDKSEGTSTVYAADGTTKLVYDTGIGQSVSYTVVKDSDISTYALTPVANPLYMLSYDQIAKAQAGLKWGQTVGGVWYGDNYSDNRTSGTNQLADAYAANPMVLGQTAGGGQVFLNPLSVAAVSIDSGKFALAYADGSKVSTPSALTITNPGVNNFAVFAHDITENSNTTDSSASTNLTVTVVDNSHNYVNVTEPIKSTTDGITASKVGFAWSNDGGPNGTLGTSNIGYSVSGNTVTVNLAEDPGQFARINGKVLVKYNPDGTKPNRSSVYFKAYDQFGTTAAPISLVSVTGAKDQGYHFANGLYVTVDNTGVAPVLKITTDAAGTTLATASNITNGDYVTLSAVTGNGKMGTMKIVFKK